MSSTKNKIASPSTVATVGVKDRNNERVVYQELVDWLASPTKKMSPMERISLGLRLLNTQDFIRDIVRGVMMLNPPNRINLALCQFYVPLIVELLIEESMLYFTKLNHNPATKPDYDCPLCINDLIQFHISGLNIKTLLIDSRYKNVQ